MPLLVFDLDGTLIDSRASILASLRHALREIGHADLEFDEMPALQQDLVSTLRQVGTTYNISFSDETAKNFISIYREHNSRFPEKFMKPYPHVRDVLAELQRDFRLAIATTKHTDQAKGILESLKLDEFFSHIQGTDSGLRYKPAPDILFAVLDALEHHAPGSAYMGDSVHDMHAAEAAGMWRLGAGYGFAGHEQLQAVDPHWMLKSFGDFRHIREDLKECLLGGVNKDGIKFVAR